jgi:CubicO group peptidase (beta-lactamase class C family)
MVWNGMKRTSTVLIAFVLLGAATSAVASSGKAKQIDALMNAYHELELFNGSVLVAQDGKVIVEKGYGLANMEWVIPNRPDTKFRIGSITKQFTSMLIMQLVQEDKLDLEATLADLLPYYRKDTGSQVTLHHLLNHTSGIPSYTGLPDFFQGAAREPHAVKNFVKTFCSGDLEFEPGAEFRYNNSGYFLLGAIIEQVTKKPYEQVLQERILEPLGMESTGYDHHGTIIEQRAAGYQKIGGTYRNAAYLDMSAPYAAGALYSTVQDLLPWDQALYDDELLSHQWKEKMFEPGLGDYAYGWGVRKQPIGPDEAERTVTGHGGGINGFNTLITRVLEDRQLVVLFNNTGGAGLQAINDGIIDVLNGREPAQPKPSIATALDDILTERGVDAAIEEYRRLKAEQPDDYEFGEQDLNAMGYALLGNKKVDAAIRVFQLNVEMFPEASNPYDSLAEAYMTAGNKDLAIKNYARSLELNPGNVNAVRQLMELTGAKE